MANPESKPVFVRLLGQTSVKTAAGTVTTFRSKQVPALLGLLLTQPGVHLRHELAHTLWPGAADDVGLHNLRQTLVYLRGILGNDALLATRTHLGLIEGAIGSDVELLLSTDRFQDDENRRQVCQEAVELAEGQFLAGMDDEWIRDERSHLSQVYFRALLYLADASMNDAPALALEYAQRAVLEEPLMDGARARLLRALIRTGEKVAAQLEYEAFADLLDQELGITPSDTVREALNDQPVARHPVVQSDSPNVSTDLSFALDSLGLGDRPYLAVELAIATTPHWVAAGTPRLGTEKLLEALGRAGTNISDTARIASTIALAELSMAKGDIIGVQRYLLELDSSKVGQTESMLVKILNLRAWLSLTRLDGRAAVEHAKSAVAVSRSTRDPNLELDSLGVLSTAGLYAPDFAGALSSADSALILAKRLGRRISAAGAHLAKAQALEEMGSFAEAEECARMSVQAVHGVQTARAINIRVSTARLLENLGHLEEAEQGYRQGLAELQTFENPMWEGVTLTFLGDIVQATGRPHEAVSLHTKALGIRREIRLSLGIATSLRGLGKAFCDLGELHAAREALTEAAHLYLNEEAVPGYASVLLALAYVEEKSGRRLPAMRLARRALKLLRGMTRFEKKMIGRSGLTAVAEAESLLERCAS